MVKLWADEQKCHIRPSFWVRQHVRNLGYGIPYRYMCWLAYSLTLVIPLLIAAPILLVTGACQTWINLLLTPGIHIKFKFLLHDPHDNKSKGVYLADSRRCERGG